MSIDMGRRIVQCREPQRTSPGLAQFYRNRHQPGIILYQPLALLCPVSLLRGYQGNDENRDILLRQTVYYAVAKYPTWFHFFSCFGLVMKLLTNTKIKMNKTSHKGRAITEQCQPHKLVVPSDNPFLLANGYL